MARQSFEEYARQQVVFLFNGVFAENFDEIFTENGYKAELEKDNPLDGVPFRIVVEGDAEQWATDYLEARQIETKEELDTVATHEDALAYVMENIERLDIEVIPEDDAETYLAENPNIEYLTEVYENNFVESELKGTIEEVHPEMIREAMTDEGFDLDIPMEIIEFSVSVTSGVDYEALATYALTYKPGLTADQYCDEMYDLYVENQGDNIKVEILTDPDDLGDDNDYTYY